MYSQKPTDCFNYDRCFVTHQEFVSCLALPIHGAFFSPTVSLLLLLLLLLLSVIFLQDFSTVVPYLD